MFSLLLLSGYLFILITGRCSSAPTISSLLSLDHRGDTAWRCFDLESSTFHRESGESGEFSAEVVSHVLDSAVCAGSNKHLRGVTAVCSWPATIQVFKRKVSRTKCHQVSPSVTPGPFQHCVSKSVHTGFVKIDGWTHYVVHLTLPAFWMEMSCIFVPGSRPQGCQIFWRCYHVLSKSLMSNLLPNWKPVQLMTCRNELWSQSLLK